MGNEELIRLGIIPWVESDESYNICKRMILSLQEKRIYNLSQVSLPNQSTIWDQEWKKEYFLNLEGIEGKIWEAYIEK